MTTSTRIDSSLAQQNDSIQRPTSKIKVLLIAERANPEYTSIPLTGWCHSRAVADLADVHVVTQHWNGPAFLRAGFSDFTGINTSIVHEPMKLLIAALRGGKGKGWTVDTALSALEYYYFEMMLWRKFGSRIKSGEFDIVHRLIPSTPTAASLIASKCKKAGVPFVIGPITGGLPWPEEFRAVKRKEKEWLSNIREIYRYMPGYKSTRENAAAIMVGSQSNMTQVEPRYQDKCVYIPSNAIDIERFHRQRQPSSQLPLKAVFIGRLVPYKGADMLIEAAAPLLKSGQMTLEIIGDGPEREALERQIQAAGLTEAVEMVGQLPQTELQDRLVKADVFTFPSIREFGGAVVIEAMAIGVVPVVVDYGGPAEMVTESTGFKVPIGARSQIVADVRKVLEELVRNPEQIDRLGKNARQRVLDKFTWEVKAEQTVEVYRWVVEENFSKPEYDYVS